MKAWDDVQSALQISVRSGSREGTGESVFLNNSDLIFLETKVAGSATDWLEIFKRLFDKIK